MQRDTELQKIIDSFIADIEQYVATKLQHASATKVPSSLVSSSVEVNALQELEDILGSFGKSFHNAPLNESVDSLLNSLGSFGSHVSLPKEDPMEVLRSLHEGSREDMDRESAVDFYIEKLSQLNGSSGFDTLKSESPGKTGIAYALDLLQRYKKSRESK